MMTVSASVTPPSSVDFSLFTQTGWQGEIGGRGKVFGTSGIQSIAILDLPGSVSLDPTFNLGGDIVRLPGNGGDWQVAALTASSSAVLTDGDTFVTVPIGTSGIAMVFDDGARTLRYDLAQASFRIGSQLFGDGLAPVSAGPDGTVLPTGLNANAPGQLYLANSASVSAGGRLTVFGTSGAEQITVTQGQVGFDPTFNLGGDTISLSDVAFAFRGSAIDSSFSLIGDDVSLTIPAGLAGLSLAFDDGVRTLVFDEDLDAIMFGSQTILRGATDLEASADAVLDMVLFWNDTALDAIAASGTPPPIASRALAITSIAVFDAISAIGGNEPYWVRLPVDGSSDINAAVAYAAHTALKALIPTQAALLDARLAEVLPSLGSGESREEGQEVGSAAAQAILALRASDGATDAVTYVANDEPGDWVPTPPAFANPLLPQWRYVEPFAMTSGDQFRAEAPPLLGSSEYAAALNEVKQIGSASSATRTADETEIALFWADGGGTYTPPGHWNVIAQVASTETGATTAQNALTFAMLNVALADAAIAAWDMKYEYDFWRPITAIRNANLDSNALTEADVEWTPLITTPPFPSYTSGHSSFSGAAAAVLTRVFGDDFVFEVTSSGLPGVTRYFDSFEEASQEAGLSRIYGGIHYSFDNLIGLEMGGQIGTLTVASFNFA